MSSPSALFAKVDLSTKPSCQQSYVDNWRKIIAPQPWNETHLKFY
jgi:hypothetical protein